MTQRQPGPPESPKDTARSYRVQRPASADDMVRCYRVELEDEPGFLILQDHSLDALMEELKAHGGDDEPVFKVTITKMRRADLEALPEFDGW